MIRIHVGRVTKMVEVEPWSRSRTRPPVLTQANSADPGRSHTSVVVAPGPMSVANH